MTATDPALDSQVHSNSHAAWEQQLGEGARAYQAFRTYLELGPPRTLGKTARLLDRSLSLIKRRSARHRWRERAVAYDDDQRRCQQEETGSARNDVYERRLAQAEHLEKVAMAGLRALLVRDPESENLRFVKGLKPTDICGLVRVAVSLLPTPPPEVGRDEEEEPGAEELGRLRDEDLEVLLGLLESGGGDEPASEEADNEAD